VVSELGHTFWEIRTRGDCPIDGPISLCLDERANMVAPMLREGRQSPTHPPSAWGFSFGDPQSLADQGESRFNACIQMRVSRARCGFRR
jgi:hypothetical protein